MDSSISDAACFSCLVSPLNTEPSWSNQLLARDLPSVTPDAVSYKSVTPKAVCPCMSMTPNALVLYVRSYLHMDIKCLEGRYCN